MGSELSGRGRVPHTGSGSAGHRGVTEGGVLQHCEGQH